MTRPIDGRLQPPSGPGPRPGAYRRPRPLPALPVRFERVEVPTHLDLWWSSDGNIWLDENLSKFSGWTMVRLIPEPDTHVRCAAYDAEEPDE